MSRLYVLIIPITKINNQIVYRLIMLSILFVKCFIVFVKQLRFVIKKKIYYSDLIYYYFVYPCALSPDAILIA